MKLLRILCSCLLAITIFMVGMQPAQAFCGFYVAKADTNLYNQASQVIIARDGERTVLTMANDYQGKVKDFALVVPVPVILKEEQVHVGNPKILSRLDSFSAPRLVEYFDSNPCEIRAFDEDIMFKTAPQAASMESGLRQERSLGVTIEEQFSVGEYDILILSAKESDGLETWLTQNGYKIPSGAKEILQPYIRQNMKFFVAKVNLAEYEDEGFEKLRPLSIAYESPKYMLPIRLGMVNAKTEQDLIVYLLSPQGQTELTNYRTVKVPSDRDIPEFVKAEFKDFYTSMFQKSYERENKQVAFLEYAWDMGSCDPCSAEPLNREELKQAGVFWLDSSSRNPRSTRNNVFITRLHVRYTGDKFPEDLKFQATGNRQLFQGRYVIRHPYTGEMNCSAANDYKRSVRDRQEREVQTLASLTGWNINDIRNKVKFVESQPIPWWRNLWNQ